MPVSDFVTRIKAIQKQLGVKQDGDFGLESARAFAGLTGTAIAPTPDKPALIRSIQRFLNCGVDGIVGPGTLTRMENYLDQRLPRIPAGSTMSVSRKGMEMLISFEVSSEQQYKKLYQHPVWPGGSSGVTIGIGYDLGYNTTTEINTAWGNKLDPASVSLLQSVSGLTGNKAKNALSGIQSITISYQTALEVFYQYTLGIFARQTKGIYPGVEKLPPDAQAGLLSLVYNRGASLEGTNRAEMKKIVPLVAAGDLAGIAAQVRSMKRIWANKGLPGLIARREQEAVLIEQAGFNILSEDIIAV